MRVMIWGDMEGVAGITSWDQVNGGGVLYEECRRLFTEEMNAAVRGARLGGASEIIAIDCHGAGGGFSFKSLVPEMLETGAEWVLGHPWARYIDPLREGVDAVVFIGAHARAGTPNGILSHTVSSEAWYNAFINDVPVGESGILAAICGVWNAPVVFAAGDAVTCEEVRDLLGPEVATLAVKDGLGRFSTRTLAPREAWRRIEDGVHRALRAPDRVQPYRPDSPVAFRVELQTIDQANVFRGRTGVELTGPRTVISRGDDFWQAWDQFWYRS